MLENREKIYDLFGDGKDDDGSWAVELLEALHNFLIMISCPYVMYPDQIGEYCGHVDKLMRELVPWHPGVPRYLYKLVLLLIVLKALTE